MSKRDVKYEIIKIHEIFTNRGITKSLYLQKSLKYPQENVIRPSYGFGHILPLSTF